MEDTKDTGEPRAAGSVDQNASSTAATAPDDPTAPELEEDGPKRTKLQTTIIMVALCTAVFLAALDQESGYVFCWLFELTYATVPASGLAMVMIIFFLFLHTPKTPLVDGLKAIDWFGSITIIGGVLMFLIGLQLGGVTSPWGSVKVLCLIVFGIVTLAIFLVVEWKIPEYPVMPLRIFKHRSNIAALIVCLCHAMVFIGGAYYLPLYFQAVLGKEPLLSGVLLLPYALTLSIGSGVVGVFIRKTGRYLEPIRLGMAVLTLGIGLLIDLPPSPGWARIILYQIVAGIGAGPNFQAPLIALQSMISPRDIATATATFGFTRMLGAGIAVVIGGVVFQNGMQSQVVSLRVSLGSETAALLSGSTAGANVRIVNSLPGVKKAVAREAFRLALRKMWILFVCVSAFGLVASLFVENLYVKTGLPQHKEGKEKDKDQEKVVPVAAPDSVGGIADKV
ncbi:hypothetical protein GP486_000839 [Trichoglossum hirsutum]|uniref:Major facilitator superfamily (MFS) profile domain-containing protein n=1 Tax=Trichoglossum hirsutum TaxID=265104 RepID=A0A9P8LHZ8_9PEZI|nr:hypothetical protein GP486_000839 [Trichoglossum hirsutum]